MEYRKLLPGSITVLGLCILFSSIWIGHSIETAAELQGNKRVAIEKALLTERECAKYLNISLDIFKDILLNDKREEDIDAKVGISVHDTYKFMPYIELGVGTKMFSRKEIDKWIQYNMHNR